MGASQSQQKIASFEKNYTKQPRLNHPYFGNHYLMIERNEKKLVVCKQMIFKSTDELKQFLSEYEKIERKPFNIIYPSLIIKNDGLETCSSVFEVNVYYDMVGKNITQVIKSTGLFNQSKAWFLLNQISKALEILSQCNRPHWAISPDNIYQNQYQNYFILDSFFVIGIDPQNFLMNKLENGEMMSQKLQALLDKGLNVSQNQGFQEDCYCLGLVILFVLTGIHPKSLPRDHHQRSQAIKSILFERTSNLSSEIVQVIFQLVEREALRRMDNYQLRRLLKEKEADIIRNEEHDYERSRKIEGETQRERFQPFQQKINLSKAHLSLHQPSSYSHHQGTQIVTPAIIQNPFSTNTNRMIPNQHQDLLSMRPRQMKPVPQGYISTYGKLPNTHPQVFCQNSQISLPADFQMIPSDRSNTLTRINSNDRLISKQ